VARSPNGERAHQRGAQGGASGALSPAQLVGRSESPAAVGERERRREMRLGFVGALWARRTLVPVPRLAPLFIVALRKRAVTAIHGRRPRSGHGLTGFSIRRSFGRKFRAAVGLR
jgi:hypothetical protein